MKHKSLASLLVALFLFAHAPLALSQQSASSGSWAAVQQLKTNEKLVVKQKDGREVKGLMIEATDTTLTIDRDGKPVSIPRANVHRVHVIEGKAQKGKWALIGAGIGAGAGTGIGATKYSPDRDDSGIYVTMGCIIGTGAGAAAGFLFGQTRRKRVLVYAVD